MNRQPAYGPETGKGNSEEFASENGSAVDRATRMQFAAENLSDQSHPLTRLTVAQERFRLTIGYLLLRQLPSDRPLPASCRGTVEVGMNHGLISAQEMLAVAPDAHKRREFRGTDRDWVLDLLDRAETGIEYQDQGQAERLGAWLEDMTRLVSLIMQPAVSR